jgi:hypothetical protein
VEGNQFASLDPWKTCALPTFRSTPSDDIFILSWVGKERALVCGFLSVYSRGY